MRQFLEFAKAKSGKRNAHLVEKLFALGHVSAQRYRRRSLVYHLHSRPIYDAIGKGELRNRRGHELGHIKARPAQDRIIAIACAYASDSRGRADAVQKTLYLHQAGGLGFCKQALSGPKTILGQAILRKYIRALAQRAGIQKPFGWHTFRHYADLLTMPGGTEFGPSVQITI